MTCVTRLACNLHWLCWCGTPGWSSHNHQYEGREIICWPAFGKSSSTHAEYVALKQYFSHLGLVIYFFPTSPIELKLGLQKMGESNPCRPIKPSSQSTAGVRLCCAFRQLQHPVQKCWAKTVLLSQTGMFWLFFIQNSWYSAPVEVL
jgi:hypothetical protein